MRECDRCGAAVTAQFVRVFGDNQRRLPGCPECAAMSELLGGVDGERERGSSRGRESGGRHERNSGAEGGHRVAPD